MDLNITFSIPLSKTTNVLPQICVFCQLADVHMQQRFVQKLTGGYGEEIGRHFGTASVFGNFSCFTSSGLFAHVQLCSMRPGKRL